MGQGSGGDDTDKSESFRGLGLVRFSEDNIESAIFNYNAAIDQDPKNSRAYRDRAEAYNKLGKKKKAEQDITKAEKIKAAI